MYQTMPCVLHVRIDAMDLRKLFEFSWLDAVRSYPQKVSLNVDLTCQKRKQRLPNADGT